MSSSTTPKSNVLFIFGDGRHGHEMAKGMCCYMEEHTDILKSFVSVVDKSFMDEMKDIEHGQVCHVEAIDLKNEKERCTQLEEIMKKHQINWLVLLPAGETFGGQCVKSAIESYKKFGGKNVIMLSVASLDKSKEEVLKKLHEAEEVVRHCCPKTSVIIRKQLPFLDLDFFLDSVKEKKAWRLPTGNGRFAPVAMARDVGCAVACVAKHEKMCQEWAGKCFTLTGKEGINGSQLADMTRTAFNEDIKFEEISMDEAKSILDKFEQKQKEQQRGSGGKSKLRRRLLNKVERCAILGIFEMIQNGEYDYTTDDFHKLTQKEPMPIEEYLRAREGKLRK